MNRLYVIGAGASCPYDLPPMKTLLWELCETLGGDDRRVIETAIEETMGIRMVDPEDSPDFEEFLNRLDIRGLLYLRAVGVDLASTLRVQAAEVALRALLDFIRAHCVSARSHEGPYDRLVASLSDDDAIVSFNWDVMIEVAFRRIGRAYTYMPREPSSIATLLLKPHGSINWFALLDRELLSIDLSHKSNMRVMGESLSYYMLYLEDPLGPPEMGNSSYFAKLAVAPVPAIVPPRSAKTLAVGGPTRDNFVDAGHSRCMEQVWRTFNSLVASADEIVLIGYSLPGTDAASILVLKQCRNWDANKKFLIIDKNPKVVERFQRVACPQARLLCSDFNDFDPAAI